MDTKIATIRGYLAAAFPSAELPQHRPDLGGGITTVFCVIENYVRHQLELTRPIVDDRRVEEIVRLLNQHAVPNLMRENPEKCVVLRAGGGKTVCDVEDLRQ